MRLILYSQPVPDAIPTIIHDNGTVMEGYTGVDEHGSPCLFVDIPKDMPSGNGCTVQWSHPDFVIEDQHCMLIWGQGEKWWLLHDVWRLSTNDAPTPPDPMPPVPGETPEEIIQYVYESTKPDLSTHNGCGRFTEDVQKTLSAGLSVLYGHIRKEPAQNQYNGHAVDAVMLLMSFNGIEAGIYDIIQNSVSTDATPAFNYVEPANPELWYNPALESFDLVTRRRK